MVTLLFLFLRANIVYSQTYISLMHTRPIYSVTSLTSLLDRHHNLVRSKETPPDLLHLQSPILVDGSYTHLVTWSETLESFLTPLFHTHIQAVSKFSWLCFQNTTKIVSPLTPLLSSNNHHLSLALLHTDSPLVPLLLPLLPYLFSIQQLKCDPFQISSTQNLPVVSHQNPHICLKGPYLLLWLWTCQWLTLASAVS